MRDLLFPLALVVSSVVIYRWQERAKTLPADALPDGSGHMLRPHWFWRLIGLTIILAWCFAFIRPMVHNGWHIVPPQGVSLLNFSLIALALLLPGIAMLLHARRRVLLLNDRIECISGYGSVTRIAWQDMKAINYSLFGYFTFIAQNGQHFRVGAKRKGLPTLLQYIKEHLHPTVYFQALSPLSGFKEP